MAQKIPFKESCERFGTPNTSDVNKVIEWLQSKEDQAEDFAQSINRLLDKIDEMGKVEKDYSIREYNRNLSKIFKDTEEFVLSIPKSESDELRETNPVAALIKLWLDYDLFAKGHGELWGDKVQELIWSIPESSVTTAGSLVSQYHHERLDCPVRELSIGGIFIFYSSPRAAPQKFMEIEGEDVRISFFGRSHKDLVEKFGMPNTTDVNEIIAWHRARLQNPQEAEQAPQDHSFME